MRLNLATKTFLTLIVTTLVVLALSAVAVRWSFERGLIDYVNEVRTRRVERLAITLAEVYEYEGSFDALRNNPRRLQRLMRIGADPVQAWRERPGARASRDERARRPPRGTFDPVSSALGITLFDEAGTVILGPPRPPGERVPIVVDGQRVGELVAAPMRVLSDGLDRDFAARQGRWLLGIFGVGLLVSSLVAWWFSRQLTRPIRLLADGTQALTKGDYGRAVQLHQSDELGQLAQDFNALSQRLQANREQRQRLMADISHELRTPLSALRAQIAALRDGVREPTAEHLEAVDGQVTRLVRLVDDIYDLSLADSGALRFDMTALDLAQLIGRVAQLFASRFDERALALELELHEPLPINGDAQRLEQLFGNVLENALRYTDPGGRVRVRGTVDGPQVVVTVDDSAPGVTQADRAHLFDRLYRVDPSRSRASGGAGLGLTLVRKIASAHGASVRAEDSALGGLRIVTTFEARRDD